jgi:inhibitor of KinA sporulation pathway (predicted exonuclease)
MNKTALNQIYGLQELAKHTTINKALELIGESIEGEKHAKKLDSIEEKVNEGNIVFTTFTKT